MLFRRQSGIIYSKFGVSCVLVVVVWRLGMSGVVRFAPILEAREIDRWVT